MGEDADPKMTELPCSVTTRLHPYRMNPWYGRTLNIASAETLGRGRQSRER